jgi:hypothetical protein
MDWKGLEQGISWKPIFLCTLLNLAAAGAAFFASILLTSSFFLAIFYTLFAWIITVTMSFLFWIWWFFEKIRDVPRGIKAGFTGVMVFLLFLDWMIIFGFLRLLV